ncbi:SAM-dependent methyltransferase [Intrasporangium oryzae NRRL B-24470]|uniref:SAM-dependent methyltransferase n=1 Tax=Intrasporangium oryzae NRRL B-24470 TaxID=1386089 RepID=W9GDH8_9MICO|nr:class I SAM-dependent methyltransferase [Intrasporangium oryzae]EWT02883.1 SAM-dependent methyltransferase [Intrasporangium oryzae NRRL B-24470]
MSSPSEATRRPAAAKETAAANRTWWDGEASDYYVEHGAFLGDTDFVWGPERLREEEAGLLGEPRGQRVLEIGAGSGQCSRWLAARGATVVASDLSFGMLATGVRVNAGLDPVLRVPLVQCDGRVLPFADSAFDTVFTAYGVVPFVADSDVVVAEAARVLRPGGRFVFSTTHPVRWAFPDDPGPGGLTANASYFDRTPYVEQDDLGRATYVEHHRTIGDRVREIARAGLVLVDLVEPEWPEGHDEPWGGWSPLRGRLIPGTAIFVCLKPA